MKLNDFLNLYDGHGKICVNDNNLRRVFIGNIFEAKICDYTKLLRNAKGGNYGMLVWVRKRQCVWLLPFS